MDAFSPKICSVISKNLADKNCIANIRSMMTFLLKSNPHHGSPHFLEQSLNDRFSGLGKGSICGRGGWWLSLSEMLKCHPFCQEHFPVLGSPHVLHLHWVSLKARLEHILVMSSPLSLTPTSRKIAFELEASLEDRQSSPPRSCRRASRLPSMCKQSWV